MRKDQAKRDLFDQVVAMASELCKAAQEGEIEVVTGFIRVNAVK